jgi:DNA-binding transcriptional regulator GbsR (MarR family)
MWRGPVTPDRALDERMRYVDRFGEWMAEYSLPRSSGRILGWLLVCDPPAQSTGDLAEALHISKGSVSTSVRLLLATGLVERFRMRGSRKTYYRMAPGIWENAFASKIGHIGSMRRLAEEGLALVGDSPDGRDRLVEMRDIYAYVEREYAEMLERWQTKKGASG